MPKTHNRPKAGQIYRVPRTGKPAHHVKVVRVNWKKEGGHAPTLLYTLVTRSGKKKPIGYGLKHLEHGLHFDGSEWRAPLGWELVEPEEV